MTPRTALRSVGAAALLGMGWLTVWAGTQPDGPQTSTVLAPATGVPTTTTVTESAGMSFRPAVTASMAPPPSH